MSNRKPNQARIVPTRFTQIARQKPSISRADAIEAGELAVTELEPEYLDWVDGLLRQLSSAVEMAGQEEDTFPTEHWDSAYSLSNQIRNLGATFDYQAVTDVADSFCELIHRLSDACRNDPHAMRTHLDALRLVSTPAFKRDGDGELAPLMLALRQLVDHYPEPVGGDA